METSEGKHVTVRTATMTKYTQTTVETSEGEHIIICMTTMTKYTQITVETSEGEHTTVCMTTIHTQITVETSEGEHITVCTTTIYTQTAVEPVKVNMLLNVRLQCTHTQLWRPVWAKYKTTKYTQTPKLQLPLKLKVGN